MKTVALFVFLVFVVSCASTTGSTSAARGGSASRATGRQTVEGELKRLETGKWRPSGIGGREGMLKLFREDSVSVQYGTDLNGGVERKVAGDSFLASPDGAQLLELLDATAFRLDEWHFVHASRDVVVVSYRVTMEATGWTAYATSVWTETVRGWQTVFYQASKAQPPSLFDNREKDIFPLAARFAAPPAGR